MSITVEKVLLKMNEIQSKGGEPIGHWHQLRRWLLDDEQIQEPFYEAVINDLEMTTEQKSYWLSKMTQHDRLDNGEALDNARESAE